MSQKYFGTDGIRGTVGGDLINPDFIRRVGYALARFLSKHNQAKPITIVIGRDTRASGEALQEAICQGMCEQGINVVALGVVPSPAVSMAVRDLHADLGIMLTASHNPASDNGLKLFDNRGLKFDEKAEAAIEAFIDEEPDPGRKELANCAFTHDSHGHYINNMKSLLHQGCLKGWKIALDTAHGAAYESTPHVLEHFGAELVSIGREPDGKNINSGLGSEHPEGLSKLVRRSGSLLGIAHDGDADRVVFVDETGHTVPGEQILGAVGLDMLNRGELRHKTVVTTIQSNLGLDQAIERAGGRVERTAVGDRHVLHCMLEKDYSLGGENSGHYLVFKHSMSGDGLLMAIMVLELMLRRGTSLSELRQAVTLFPQKTRNLMVAHKHPLAQCRELSRTQAKLDAELQGCGRILVRYSGTEPKLRLLAEAQSDALANEALERLLVAAEQDLTLVDADSGFVQGRFNERIEH